MVICLACYRNRLAACFENAAVLRFYRVEDGAAEQIGAYPPVRGDIVGLVAALKGTGAAWLLCGAISGCGEKMVSASGVRVAGFLQGEVDEVLNAYLEDRLVEMYMPGALSRPGRGLRNRRPCCRRRNTQQEDG